MTAFTNLLWYDCIYKFVVVSLPAQVCYGMTACTSLLWYDCLQQ